MSFELAAAPWAEATEYDRSRLADGVLYNRSICRRGQRILNLFRIVHVRAYSPSFEWRDYGLGCLISAELVVTASHVSREVETQVENALYIQRFDVVNSCDGIGLLPASLMFRDEDQDVALLRVQRTLPTFQSSLSGLREPNLRPLTELRPDEAASCYLAPPLGGEQGHFDPAPESLMLQRLRLLEQTPKEKWWFLTESPRFEVGNSGSPITADSNGDLLGVCCGFRKLWQVISGNSGRSPGWCPEVVV
jgi:hypothetical protein